MPGTRKTKPVVSEAQRRFFGAELARLMAGKATESGMTKHDLKKKLEGAKGKKLPRYKVDATRSILR